jgi:biopolymer transport protein ExbD
MAFGSFDQRGEDSPMSEINMIPFIDIMLVLLIIFIVTAPLLTHAVKIELPKVSSSANISKMEKLDIAVKANGEIFLNGVPTPKLAIPESLKAFANSSPEIQIRVDKEAKYDTIAFIMAEASKARLSKLAFVTEP